LSKNLGLAYFYLLRLQLPSSTLLPRLDYTDIFKGLKGVVTTWHDESRGVDWNTWATAR